MKTSWQAGAGAIGLAMALSLFAESVSEQPLPSLETVVQRVTAQAEREGENDRAFNQRYAYTRTKVTEYRNARGDLKKREEKKNTHDLNFAPASPSPQPSTKPTRSPKNSESDGPVTDTRSNVRGKAFERKDFSLSSDLLSRFQIALAGRESVNGRPALMLDFKPANKKLPERNLKDRFINKAAGRVWVDEEDYALAKADLHLTSKVNVVGGLVGAVWIFNYTFNRERTADGLWFTRSVDWHLEGREVIVRRTVDYHEQRTEVRKAR